MTSQFSTLIEKLHQYLDEQETNYSQTKFTRSTLFDHCFRVAKLAQKIARQEKTVTDDLAFLGGLFHDVGKFKDSKYHVEGVHEEYRSAQLCDTFLTTYGFDNDSIETIVTAIKDLHQDDHKPTILSQIIQDADNLDKLAHLGIANFFLKAGLRGQGINEEIIYKMSIELTYAFHAINTMWTKTAKNLAREKAKISFQFFQTFIKSLKEDGLYDFEIEKIDYQGRQIYSVFRPHCDCGVEMKRKISSEKTFRCNKINFSYHCNTCNKTQEVNFCCPYIIQS